MTRRLVGCLLRDVLDRAGLVETRRFDLRRSVVIATASDGYRAVFSWAELYLSPIGDGAMIVYERDGAALPDSEGPLALVSLKDTRPGPATSNGCARSTCASSLTRRRGRASVSALPSAINVV